MSDLTAELNLALCVDNDDTADYLTQTAGLRGSLNTIDGLFSSTTGHNHSGAHQGGNFTSLNLSGALTVGGNLQVNGTAVVSGATTLQSLNVATTSLLQGAVTTSGNLSVGGTFTVTGATTLSGTLTAAAINALGIASGPPISATNGDLSANRGGNSGIVFLGNGSHYVSFDGFNYQMPTSWLYINGDRAVTEAAAQTLTGKTLNSPTFNSPTLNSPIWGGTLARGGAQNSSGAPLAFEQATGPKISLYDGGAGTFYGLGMNASEMTAVLPNTGNTFRVRYGTNAGTPARNVMLAQDNQGFNRLDSGQIFFGSIANGASGATATNYNGAFAAAPNVIISLNSVSGGDATVGMTCFARTIGTNGFVAVVRNASGGTQSVTVDWVAVGN